MPDNLAVLDKLKANFDEKYLPWYMSQVDTKEDALLILGYFLEKKQYNRVQAILDLCGSKSSLKRFVDDKFVATLISLDKTKEFWTIDKAIRPLIKTRALPASSKGVTKIDNTREKINRKKEFRTACSNEIKDLKKNFAEIKRIKVKGGDKASEELKERKLKKVESQIKHYESMSAEALAEIKKYEDDITAESLPSVIKALNLFNPHIYATPEDESLFKLFKENYSETYRTLLKRVIEPAIIEGKGEENCIACRFFNETKSLGKKGRGNQPEEDFSFGPINLSESGKDYTGDNFSEIFPKYNLCSNDKDGLHKLLVILVDEGKVRDYPSHKSLKVILKDKVGSDIELFTHNYLYQNGLSYVNVHSIKNINSARKIFLREVQPSSARKFRYDFYIPKIKTFIEIQGDKFHGFIPTIAGDIVKYFNAVDEKELSQAVEEAENTLETLRDLSRNKNYFEEHPEEKEAIIEDFKKIIRMILDAFRDSGNKRPEKLADIPAFNAHIEQHGLEDFLSIAKTAATISKSSWTNIAKIIETISEGSKLVLKDMFKRYIVENRLRLYDYFEEGKYHLIELHQHHFEMKGDTCEAEKILRNKVFKPLGITPNTTMSKQIELETLQGLYGKYNISEDI